VINNGQQVHTLTTGNAPATLDTGGLATNQSKSFVLSALGTYEFSSATDCLNGNKNAQFDCSTPNTITVTSAPVGATNLTTPGIGSTLIYIHDDTGFDPVTKTVPVGTTVTWLNLGRQAHSVQSDAGVNPPFNSGGVSQGGTFTVTFSQPGTYSYHSSADPVFNGSTQTGYRFSGKIVVE
jgi:plastocyanin